MLPAALTLAALGLATPAQPGLAPEPVEIVRTRFGVPHVYAANLHAAGFGLAWVMLEDYGADAVLPLVAARGELARLFGPDSIESDFRFRPLHDRARQVWLRLDPGARAVYAGYAAGVNRFIELHPDLVPAGVQPDFAGWDVLTREVDGPDLRGARRLVDRTSHQAAAAPGAGERDPDEGSNAWALAPSRTTSGHAILLRNPHLSWEAGYYEAHLVVPDTLDFYGDFRIGGPFGVIGGFNRDLGWATTNNAVDRDEVYALDAAPGMVDRVLLDGRPVALTRDAVTVEYRNGEGYAAVTRETWRTPVGPVIDRKNGKVYVLRTAAEGEFRNGEQFLRMMRARSLAEWKAAMRMQARASSNFTYADRAGNVFYVWNGTLPALPHPPGGDSLVIPARTGDDVFTALVPWDSLPMMTNPRGGYLHNENDAPFYANLVVPLDPARYPPNVEPPSFRLRSQHAVALIGDPREKLSLEEVIRRKHDYGMLLAQRVKLDLLRAAGRPGRADSSLAAAARVLEAWDDTAAPDSRGGVLFEAWWRRYAATVEEPFAEPWTPGAVRTTPRGLADPEAAVAALRQAADSVERRFGRLDVAWGEVHRVRIGEVDVPVGGCSGDLGCFRVLGYREAPDGKLVAARGDGWVLAVEFGAVPRAYSILAYGESRLPTSPHHSDQAAMFARGELKPVAFTRAEVERQAERRYRPGAP